MTTNPAGSSPALRIPCPVCGAGAGAYCMKANGNRQTIAHKKRREQAMRAIGELRAQDARPLLALSDMPCPRCLNLALDNKLRTETVQRLPGGVGVAPIAHDGSGPCCFDCAYADGLAGRMKMTFEMARIAVGNDRQEQYRLPGTPMGLVLLGLRPSAPGDLEDQHAWLDRHSWFNVDDR